MTAGISYCSKIDTHSVPQAVYVCANWSKFPGKRGCFFWLFVLNVVSSLFRFSLGRFCDLPDRLGFLKAAALRWMHAHWTFQSVGLALEH